MRCHHPSEPLRRAKFPCLLTATPFIALLPTCLQLVAYPVGFAHGLRNELVRRISGRKGVYRKISGLLESLVHTQLILAMWLKFRKEKGSVACWGQRLRTSKSSMLRVVSATRVWLNLNWLNS